MAPHKLRKAIALIDHHLSDEEEGRVALRVVARDVRMSYFHFSRAFKQAMGMTATNYIAERRIERAKKMLEETELPISEIACAPDSRVKATSPRRSADWPEPRQKPSERRCKSTVHL
jgi:AraC family transcriptional regulator